MNTHRLLGLCLTIAFSAIALHANDAKGQQLYQVCAACHGDKGQGMQLLEAPSIAGMELTYLTSTISKFKHGVRGAHEKDSQGLKMKPMMMTLKDDADINTVAAYINKMAPVKAAATIKDGDANKGKNHYTTCLACHGDKAQGIPAMKAPSLQNLPDWYMLTQLKKFKEGVRGGNPKDAEGMLMSPMAKMLPDEQAMKDVIAYINSISASAK